MIVLQLVDLVIKTHFLRNEKCHYQKVQLHMEKVHGQTEHKIRPCWRRTRGWLLMKARRIQSIYRSAVQIDRLLLINRLWNMHPAQFGWWVWVQRRGSSWQFLNEKPFLQWTCFLDLDILRMSRDLLHSHQYFSKFFISRFLFYRFYNNINSPNYLVKRYKKEKLVLRKNRMIEKKRFKLIRNQLMKDELWSPHIQQMLIKIFIFWESQIVI
jgi:hypothetical protein